MLDTDQHHQKHGSHCIVSESLLAQAILSLATAGVRQHRRQWRRACTPTYLPIYAFLRILTYLLIYRSTYLPNYQITYLPIYLSTYLPVYRSTCIPTYLSAYLPVYRSTYLPIEFPFVAVLI